MSDPAIGTYSKVVADYEQSWGVAKVAPAGFHLPVTSCAISPSQTLLPNPTLTGDLNERDPAFGPIAASGNLVKVADLVSLPWFTGLLCGNLVGTGTTPNFIHTSIVSTDVPKSAVVETSFNIGGSLRYSLASGVRINNMTIPIDSTGFLTTTYAMEAKNVALGSTAYNATPADWTTSSSTPFDGLQLASADVKVGGSSVGYISKGNISIAAGLGTTDYRVGSGGARGSLTPSVYKVTGSLDLALDSVAVLTLLASGSTPSALSFTWTQGTNKTFTVNIPRVFIQRTGPTLTGPGAIMVTATFNAAYDSGTASSIQFVTANQTDNTVYV